MWVDGKNGKIRSRKSYTGSESQCRHLKSQISITPKSCTAKWGKGKINESRKLCSPVCYRRHRSDGHKSIHHVIRYCSTCLLVPGNHVTEHLDELGLDLTCSTTDVYRCDPTCSTTGVYILSCRDVSYGVLYKYAVQPIPVNTCNWAWRFDPFRTSPLIFTELEIFSSCPMSALVVSAQWTMNCQAWTAILPITSWRKDTGLLYFCALLVWFDTSFMLLQ